MIEADRQELEANLKLLTLQIREKELAVFTQNFSVLATQASLLAGLGYSGLTMTPVWAKSGASLNASCAFMGLASLGVGFNILTLTVSSWAMIQGTHLAIAGPDGSMSRAVAGMHMERKWAIRFYWSGLTRFMLSVIALGWLKFQSSTAFVLSFVVACLSEFRGHHRPTRFDDFFLPLRFTVMLMLWYIRRITQPRFIFEEEFDSAISGIDPERDVPRRTA